MSSVDERIVEMRFDNQQFETGVKTSLNTLDNLEKGLKNIGSSASNLTNLQTTADNFDISGISNGVDLITNRFSTLGIVADQVIRRVTNGLVDLGIQAANSAKNFVLTPISSGFAQYEQETKSIQTLMNATGLGMEEVEKYSEKLGFYVDETSYSYESMLKTVTGMMGSGVENMDTAMSAVIGLGNAAGLAGVDAEQATHAFEGFGKAIAQNKMDSRTWSYIKTARMDTAALKQGFIDAGVAAGTLVRETDKAGNTLTYIANAAGKANKKLGEINVASFEESFRYGWLTKDVMLDAVGKYSVAFEQIYSDYLETGDTAEDIINRLGGDLDEYSLKAFKAANQTRTFTDVVEYISGAASRRWSNAFKKIFGNFEESSALWASLIDPMYEIFITPLDNMNDLLDNWRDLGGYEHVVNGITSAFDGLVNIVTAVRAAFSDIFPKVTSERLFEITEGIQSFTEKFRNFTALTKDEDGNLYAVNGAFANLIRGFKGGLSIVSLVGKAFKTLFTSLSPITNLFKKIGDKAITTFGKIGQSLIDFNNSKKVLDFFNTMSEKMIDIQTKLVGVLEKVNEKFNTFWTTIKGDVLDGLKGLWSGVQLVAKGLKALWGALSPVGEVLKSFGESIANFLLSVGVDIAGVFGNIGRFLTELNNCTDSSQMLAKVYEKLAEVSDKVTAKFSKLKTSLKGVYDEIKNFVKSNLLSKFEGLFDNLDFTSVATALGGLVGVLASVNIYRLIDWFKDDLKYVTDPLGKIKTVLQEVEDSLWAFGQNVSADVIKKIAIAIALLAASLLLLGSVDVSSLSQGLLAISVLLAELYTVMFLFKKNDVFSAFSGNFMSTSAASTSLLKIAGAVLILAAAVKMLSGVENVFDSIISVTVLLGALTVAATLLSKYAPNMTTGAAGMIGMAAAVLILSIAVKSLSSISSGLEDGLLGVIGLLGALTIAGITLSKYGGKLVGVAVGMIGISAAMVIMAAAVKQFNAMDANAMGNSIFGITALLAVIAAFNQLGGSAVKMIAAAASLLVVSAALVVMSGALAAISTIDASSLGNSIFGITALLTVIAAFNQLGGSGAKMITAAASLLVVSAALVVMSGALAAISAIDANSLGNSIFGITALLTIIAAFNRLGGSAVSLIGMGAGLIIMAVALTTLIPALLAMGAASDTAANGILVLAGIFIVLGAAATLLSPLIIPILALSAALLVISAAIAVAGAGLLLLSAGMTAFSGALAVSVVEIIAAFDALILGLASIAASLVGAVAMIISAIALGLVKSISVVVSAVLQLVLAILNALVQNIPAIATAGIQLITGLINAIASQIGPLVEAGLNLIISFINGMADAVSNHAGDILNAVGKLMGSVIGLVAEALARLLELIPGIGDRAAKAVRDGAEKVKAFLSGEDLSDAGEQVAESAVEGVTSGAADMENAGTELGSAVSEGMESTAEEAETAGSDDAQAMLDGIESLMGDANSTGSGFSSESLSGMTSMLSSFCDVGGDSGQGFIDGLKGKYADAFNAGAGLGSSALSGAKSSLDSHSPSKEFMRIGGDSGEGFMLGMKSTFRGVYESSEEMGKIALDAISDSLKYISDFINSDNSLNPVITPVVDLTNVRSAGSQMRQYFGANVPVNLNGSPSSSTSDMSIMELVQVGYNILKAIENGSDLYFDDGAFAGRINRRLGIKI